MRVTSAAVLLSAAAVTTVHAIPQARLPLWPRSSTLPLCFPPDATAPFGVYPASAVTTKQTGTDCTQYGDPPAQVVSDVQSPDGLQALIAICEGEIVSVTDNLGEKRMACLYVNPASTASKPLPLVVWLHPSGFTSTVTWPLTGWETVKTTQPLNNEDASAVGFSYILPFGRNTVHQYPVPDNVALGWDNWYRNLNRSSSSLNADVDFIDKAIALAKSRAPVDNRRVFMSGWSNGAAMSLLYALNTDKIAAASVYSAPDPYRDSQDPCTQVPHPKYATPTQDVHNYCDIIGICTTGKYFYSDLRKRYPRLRQSLVIIDTLTAAVKSTNNGAQCNPSCQGACVVTEGTAAHGRWSSGRNSDTFFCLPQGQSAASVRLMGFFKIGRPV